MRFEIFMLNLVGNFECYHKIYDVRTDNLSAALKKLGVNFEMVSANESMLFLSNSEEADSLLTLPENATFSLDAGIVCARII
jgi:hypothetical protein